VDFEFLVRIGHRLLFRARELFLFFLPESGDASLVVFVVVAVAVAAAVQLHRPAAAFVEKAQRRSSGSVELLSSLGLETVDADFASFLNEHVREREAVRFELHDTIEDAGDEASQ